jgi:hypothetical protein
LPAAEARFERVNLELFPGPVAEDPSAGLLSAEKREENGVMDGDTIPPFEIWQALNSLKPLV